MWKYNRLINLKGDKMGEKSEYKIIVDNVYKTFNVYLDRANTIKEKFSE